MSIIIHYPEDSIVRHMANIVDNHEVALNFDAIDTLVHGLVETSIRLANRLAYSTDAGSNGQGGNLAKKLVLADIWNFLDNGYRTIHYIKRTGLELPAEAEPMFTKLNKFRNSYQHLETRIRDAYAVEGADGYLGKSVYGDFFFRFRSALDAEEEVWMHSTGINRGENNISFRPDNANSPIFQNRMGVYELNLAYIVPLSGGRFEEEVLKVDEVAGLINGGLYYLNSFHTQAMQAEVANNPDRSVQSRGMGPISVRLY
ncbi:hypothetical protein HER32_00400 [Hymenobacter sp. BT18]|uniref:hypothetical protein n=1 Tax=Hymenobacter sp. BT18 TaxID=2835648 RepID=UPI00143E6111|nr:hypothetical protein [Hymenobacter sp. BT18]QIX59733.1 hypothetical protein HER32_00400 [Hymenobacter sp. BT18]